VAGAGARIGGQAMNDERLAALELVAKLARQLLETEKRAMDLGFSDSVEEQEASWALADSCTDIRRALEDALAIVERKVVGQ
jgi:hypothetical protein